MPESRQRVVREWASYRYKIDIRFLLPPDNKLSLNDITIVNNQDQLTGPFTLVITTEDDNIYDIYIYIYIYI